jgi:hypothetical protein
MACRLKFWRGFSILLDGMRWDLWEYLKESFFKPLAHQLRIVDEGALWAHLPSSTPRQMELLQQSMEKTFPAGKGWTENLWKFGGIDERVHTERGDWNISSATSSSTSSSTWPRASASMPG